MDFPNPSAKAAFGICFTLAFESISFERKTMKRFVSGIYQSFFAIGVKSPEFQYCKTFLFLFHDFCNLFL